MPGKKICEKYPCEGKCRSYTKWACQDRCIPDTEPCMEKETCQAGGLYPFFCKETNRCVAEWDTCGENICVSPKRQIWGPWNDYCYEKESDCKMRGPVIEDGTMYMNDQYMCNGFCIPAIIPCNNTCLDHVEWTENTIESLEKNAVM